jgi:glutaredoxin
LAKEYFVKNNVAYQEFNVAEDDAAREEMVNKSRQFGVPVIDINGNIIVGFNRQAVAKALNLAP